MKNIYLCGFMGCGKSTVGRLLAQRLGMQFLDTDFEIEKISKLKISDIFEQKGETAFRKMETALLLELNSKSNLVISTGGGMMTNSQNFSIARQNGTVLLLYLPFEECFKRIRFSSRPLVTQNSKQQLQELFDKRCLQYKKNAQISIDANKAPFACVSHIIRVLNLP